MAALSAGVRISNVRLKGRFLKTRVARRFFVSVFLLTALILFSVGTLFYQLGNELVHRATVAVVNESTREIGRNLFDTLTSAARLLASEKARGLQPESDGLVALEAHQREVFTSIRVLPSNDVEASNLSVPRLISENPVQSDDPPKLSIIVPADRGRGALKGTLRTEHVWERVQSGLYSLCFETGGNLTPYCQASSQDDEKTVTVTRKVLFRPFLDAPPWQMKATTSSALTMLMPVSLGLVATGISALAFCIALIASSVYLRRWAGSLESFMGVTGQAIAGDFSDRVPVQNLKDELRDLGSSFNVMMESLQANFDFTAVLSRMDLAILERTHLEQVIQLVLKYAKTLRADASPMLVCDLQNIKRVYSLSESDDLLIVDGKKSCNAIVDRHIKVNVGPMHGGLAVLFLKFSDRIEVNDTSTLLPKLQDLGRRLAIAAEAGQHEADLIRQANTDSLTGLLNRHGFITTLEASIHNATCHKSFDVALIDLDGFKEVNDAFGHAVGDEVLRQFGKQIASLLGHDQLGLARLGGDEFALMLPLNAATEIARKLKVTLDQPFQIESREIKLAFSMGCATFPNDGKTVADLLRQSDLAMYEAKEQNGSTLVRFRSEMDAATVELLSLLHELRRALDGNLLHVVYQPRISCATNRIVSAEALMRWKHPVLGWVSPGKFIPLAEESGLVIPFGYWILEKSCEQYNAWQSAGLEVAHISVNVSPIQMMAPTFFEEAIAILRRHAIPAGGIELEITEGAMVQNVVETSKRIRELQNAGFCIALDDFGVGYSALSYLHEIPFDTLKIDQSFVKNLHDSQVSLAIASAIITLAKTLGKRIVAEGVEIEEHATVLKDLGVDELQGFLFGRPMENFALMGLEHASFSC